MPTLSPDSALSSSLEPRVDLNLNVTERKTGGLSAGGGISASVRLFSRIVFLFLIIQMIRRCFLILMHM